MERTFNHRPAALGGQRRQPNPKSRVAGLFFQQALQQCCPIPAEIATVSVRPSIARTKKLPEIPALFAIGTLLYPLGRMHQGNRQQYPRRYLPRKIGVAEAHRLTCADCPMKGGQIHRWSRGQIRAPEGLGAHVEQLVDAAEKGSLWIGYCPPRQCGFGCGHWITTMACQGKTPWAWVTQFRLQDGHRLRRHAGCRTLPKANGSGKPGKPDAERTALHVRSSALGHDGPGRHST
jgi:hypothetical protein